MFLRNAIVAALATALVLIVVNTTPHAPARSKVACWCEATAHGPEALCGDPARIPAAEFIRYLPAVCPDGTAKSCELQP